jgi:hypothetical protein
MKSNQTFPRQFPSADDFASFLTQMQIGVAQRADDKVLLTFSRFKIYSFFLVADTFTSYDLSHILSQFSQHCNCYVSLKNHTPWQDSNPGLLFLQDDDHCTTPPVRYSFSIYRDQRSYFVRRTAGSSAMINKHHIIISPPYHYAGHTYTPSPFPHLTP